MSHHAEGGGPRTERLIWRKLGKERWIGFSKIPPKAFRRCGVVVGVRLIFLSYLWVFLLCGLFSQLYISWRMITLHHQNHLHLFSLYTLINICGAAQCINIFGTAVFYMWEPPHKHTRKSNSYTNIPHTLRTCIIFKSRMVGLRWCIAHSIEHRMRLYTTLYSVFHVHICMYVVCVHYSIYVGKGNKFLSHKSSVWANQHEHEHTHTHTNAQTHARALVGCTSYA